MSRRNLTSKKRSFRSNPSSFLNKITEAPINLEVSDGVGGTVTVVVNPQTATIANSEDLPPDFVTNVGRQTSGNDLQ